MTSPGILCSDVTKTFSGTSGIAGLSLAVPPSTSYALVGANGAGKTTLMNVCLGFLAPDSGSVSIDGIDVHREPIAARRRLAYVPEVARLYAHLTALQNMAVFEGLMGREHPASVYEDVLAHLNFPRAAATERVSTYSKGMRQKLAIAIGLLKGASVFLLDEPTSGLDPRSAIELNRMIQTLRNDGKAILFASHDLHSVYTCADRVGVLSGGRMLFEESGEGLRKLDTEALYHALDA